MLMCRYRRRLVAPPLLTQSITTAVLFAIGDVTAQQLIECRGLEKHEFSRTARMLFYGGGMSPLRVQQEQMSNVYPSRIWPFSNNLV